MLASDVSTHHNAEQVIRYYLLFLPPRGVESILDIGGGTSAPYRGVLRTRCKTYANLDIREGKGVDYVADVCNLHDIFKPHQWEWGWCSEVLEHIDPKHKTDAVNEILYACKNVVFTFPTPRHPSFEKDTGHSIVLIDWYRYSDKYTIINKSTKNGRAIIIVKLKEEK